MNNRLEEIDGLRALAVLGVTWAHCWMFFDNLDLIIYKIPINRLLSFGGVGVNLFFVISGFCMTMTFTRNYQNLNLTNIKDFVVKRFLRIAPVYYIALVVYTIDYYIKTDAVPIVSLFTHFAFIQTIFDLNIIGAHFWSLATEWHFYMFLPLIFIFGFNRNRIFISTSILIILCIISRLIHWGYLLDSPLSIEHSDFIYLRFVEFGWGIFVYLLFEKRYKLPLFLNGNFGVIMALFIAFMGRFLSSTPIINRVNEYGFVVKSLAEPIMTFGFALLVLNVITTKNLFSRFLCTKAIQFIGKISYSFYLWHWLVCSYICFLAIKLVSINNFALEISFIFSVLITSLISNYSYTFIELKFHHSPLVKLFKKNLIKH